MFQPHLKKSLLSNCIISRIEGEQQNLNKTPFNICLWELFSLQLALLPFFAQHPLWLNATAQSYRMHPCHDPKHESLEGPNSSNARTAGLFPLLGEKLRCIGIHKVEVDWSYVIWCLHVSPSLHVTSIGCSTCTFCAVGVTRRVPLDWVWEIQNASVKEVHCLGEMPGIPGY